MNRSPLLFLVALGLVAAITAAETNAGATAGASPLRLIGPERASDPAAAAPAPPSGPAAAADAGARLQNVSDEPLAGWHFACVVGFPDGRSGWVGGGKEAFRSPVSESALLAPGETAPVTLPEAPARESPFAVWACGPAAAVFADGRTWGAPEVLDRFFERLVANAGEARRLLDAIERLQPEGRSELLTGGEAVAALETALPEDRLGNYRGRVDALGAAAAGSEVASRLASLAAEVRRDLDSMLPRLRPQDRRQLDSGAPPPPVQPPGQRTAVVVALGDDPPAGPPPPPPRRR